MDLVNNNSNFALYLFLFLSLLSVGNDIYEVYLSTMDTEFVKNQKEKFGTYIKLFEDLMCNKVKKVKNKLIFEEVNQSNKSENKINIDKESSKNDIDKQSSKNDIDKQSNKMEKDNQLDNQSDNQSDNNIKKKEIYEISEEIKKSNVEVKIKKKKKIKDENNIIDKKSNNDYENNINILKKIVKKKEN